MSKTNSWQPIVNFIGAVAYLAIFMQWLWLLATIAMPLISNDQFQEFILPPQPTETNQTMQIDVTIPPLVQTIIVIASIVFAVGVSLYAIYLVPRSVSRTGHTSVKKAATFTVEHTARQQPIKPKQKQRLVTRYVWLIKLLAVILPPVLALIPIYQAITIEHQLVIIMAVFLAALSLMCLGLQLLVAYLTKVPIKNLW